VASTLRHQLTSDGAIVGTPDYMAPEQREGRAVDARADQYAFCLALSRALGGGDAAMPRWLRPLAQRGLAADADARHPSMDALLAALARGPLVTPRRALALAAAVAVAAGVAALVA